jgi:hypothetical protein
MPTLVIEDGTDVADANSYVTEAEFRLYAMDRGVDMSILDSPIVGSYLIKACDWIEGQDVEFVGQHSFENQSLCWPRTVDRRALGVPKNVRMAQCAAALAVHEGIDLFPVVDGGLLPSEEGVGPIKVKYSRDRLLDGPSLPAAMNLLKPYYRRGLDYEIIRA